MTCALTQGYTIDCRDSVGGIKEVYITELANIETAPTDTMGVISTIDMVTGKQFWKYQLIKETGTASEKIQTNEANGTIFYEQDLSFPIRKLQASTRNELKLLAQNTLAIIVLDRNGKYWLMGRSNGMTLEPSEAQFGKAMGDFNGYNLVFKGKEEQSMCEVSSGAVAGLLVPAT